MAKPDSVAYNTQNFYDKGTNFGNGPQSKTWFYDTAGIKAATAKKVYQQFASVTNMPLHNGREYRVKLWYPSWERTPYDETTSALIGGKKAWDSDFNKYGYISSRNLPDVTAETYGTDGVFPTATTFANNGKRLLEGEMQGNQTTLSSTILNAYIEKFGESLTYTKETVLFAEDQMEVIYREDLGGRANQLYEDLLQIDMLGTPNVMFAGPATSLATLGTGIGVGTPDPVTGTNAVEESYKINFDLIQKALKKLFINRAPKHTALLTGDVKIGTRPIPECYVAIVGPEIAIDLQNMVRGTTYEKHFVFTEAERYAGQTKLFDNEIGMINGIRFIVSETAMVERAAGAEVDAGYIGSLSYSESAVDQKNHFDIFPILIPCKDAFVTLSLVGQSKITFKHVTPDSVDKTDHFGAIGIFSYQFYYGTIITRPERLLRLNVLASA